MARNCSQCGEALAVIVFERTVFCSHCQTAQPNLDCMPVGQELLFKEGKTFTLATVVACRGPDEIEVTGPKTMKLEEVTAVMRPDSLQTGTLVYALSGFGWELTWTVSEAKDGAVKIKHPDARFQADLFNHEQNLDAVRIPAREKDQQHRVASLTLLEELQTSPGAKAVANFTQSSAFLAFVLATLFVSALVGYLLYLIIAG